MTGMSNIDGVRDYCIWVSNLRKQYGKNSPYAVDDITFDVRYGTVFGFLGPNGNKVNEILITFDLESIRNIKNDELSIGQRRRVQVAREFMHEMDLLFLDEPMVGLDPSARRLLLDYIKSQVKSGLTVFFTTHIMEEAEYLCDQIAIIDKGKIIAFDTPSGLKQKYGRRNKTIELTFNDIPDKLFIDRLKNIVSMRQDGKTPNGADSLIGFNGAHAITITTDNVEEIISEVLQLVYKLVFN